MSRLFLKSLSAFSIGLLVTACGGGGGSSSGGGSTAAESSVELDAATQLEKARSVLTTNADIALAAYSDALDTALALQNALATFQAAPTQANLDAAKRAWLVAREPYGQTEVYRFRLSPIDSTDYATEDGPEGDINAWPLGEALIDYVKTGTDFGDDQVGVTEQSTGVDYPAENIINSSVAIDAELIANTATAEDEHDVIAGYHAIEFMLWGQDLNRDSSADTVDSRDLSTTGDILNSGGQRPLTDFTTDPYAERRHQYLAVVAAKLIEDLTQVRAGWLEGASYRSAFTGATSLAEANTRIAEILTGMGTLSEGELAGERMQIAFSSGSQEDEHSCFSDNTHRDIWLNAEGVANSFYGDYNGFDSTLDGVDDTTARAVTGYGLDDYLTDLGLTDLVANVSAALSTTEVGYTAIDRSARVDGIPVDVLIETQNRNADNPMYSTIVALNAQSALIAGIADALKITSAVVDDDASSCDTTNPTASCE